MIHKGTEIRFGFEDHIKNRNSEPVWSNFSDMTFDSMYLGVNISGVLGVTMY